MKPDDLMARTMELARTFDKRAQFFDLPATTPTSSQTVPPQSRAPQFYDPTLPVPPATVQDILQRGPETAAPTGEIGMQVPGQPEAAPEHIPAPVPYSAGPAGIQDATEEALQQAPQGMPLTPQEQAQATFRLEQSLIANQTPEQRKEWTGRLFGTEPKPGIPAEPGTLQSPEGLQGLVENIRQGRIGPRERAAVAQMERLPGGQLPGLEGMTPGLISDILGEEAGIGGVLGGMLEKKQLADAHAAALQNNPDLFNDPSFMQSARDLAPYSAGLPTVIRRHTDQQSATSAAMAAMNLPQPIGAPAAGSSAPAPVAVSSSAETPTPSSGTPVVAPSGDSTNQIPDLAGALDAPARIFPAPMPTPVSVSSAQPPPSITAPPPPAPVTPLPMLPPPAPVQAPVVATGPQPVPTAAGEMGMKSWGQQASAPDVQWAAGGTPVGLPGAQRATGGSPVGTLAVGGNFGGGSASGQPTPALGFQTPPRNPFTHVAALGILAPLLENLYQRQPGLVKEAADLSMQAFILATQDLKEFAGSESFQEAMAKVAVSIPGIDPKETEMLTKAAQAELVGRLLAHGQLFRMSVAPAGSEP